MSVLNKRYCRSVKSNLAFYISASLLTLVTLLLFYLFYIGGTGILQFGESFFAEHNLEDAHFTTYKAIADDDIAEIESQFDLVLEAQKSMDITQNGVTARVFKANKKINLYEITAGEDMRGVGDIIISEGYAVNTGVNIGDSITLNGGDYTVKGYFQRPDYLYMLQEEDDSYKNISTFFLAYVTDDDFESLGSPNVTYLVKYGQDNEMQFRKAVYDRYYTQSYLGADENMRILAVDEQAEMFLVMSYVILIAMPLIAVLLVCIIISSKVKDEQKLIGALSSFGYSKGKLAAHYALFAVIPAAIGGILAFAFAAIFAQPYGALCLSDYEPLHIAFSLPVYIGLLGVAVPAVMYVAAAAIAVARLLRRDTVAMLNGRVEGKSLKTAFRGGDVNFAVKWSVRSLIGSPARTLAVFLGIFLGSAVILIGLGMIDSVDAISDTAINSTGSFEYEYIFTSLQTQTPEYGSPMLVSSFAEETKGKRVTFTGLEDGNPFIVLKDGDGEVENLDGYYISSAASAALSIKGGDRATFFNPLTIEYFSIEIAGVVEYDIGSMIFTSNGNMAELLSLESGTYNAVMSDIELSFEDGEVYKTVRKSSLKEQCDTILDQMGPMIYAMVFLGMIICVAAVFVAVNMLVTENRNNVSMLKVLGYSDRKISEIIFMPNHILLPSGILAGVPAAIGCMSFMWKLMLDYGVMLITTAISPLTYILTAAFTSVCYFGSVWLASKKVKKVNMAEALKDARE
ncbi:MAG: FtsX-like permease family protein [Clostridia bacterium]|nr:FtsX-like permease family protein [Clostridia bacterium]